MLAPQASNLAALALVLAASSVLVALQLGEQADALPWPFQAFQQNSASSSSSSQTTTTLIRLRANRVRRPEWCRESLPRKSDELPPLVAVGRVKEVYLSGADQAAAPAPDSSVPIGADPRNNRALINLNRIIKGKRDLLNSDIVVTGFNASNPALSQCPNFVKPNDTLILFLLPESDPRKYSIQGGNLLSMSLQNLDKVNALAADEPYKRRGPIEDILCEVHYCAYGRCKIVDAERAQVKCECPDSCAPSTSVCGSDNATYPSECHLIREGCRRQKPLFVTKESAC